MKVAGTDDAGYISIFEQFTTTWRLARITYLRDGTRYRQTEKVSAAKSPLHSPKFGPQMDTRCSAIAYGDRPAGCVIVLAKSGRRELGDNILRIL